MGRRAEPSRLGLPSAGRKERVSGGGDPERRFGPPATDPLGTSLPVKGTSELLAPSSRLFAESRSAGDVEFCPNRQDVAEGGGGQASRRSIRTREEQDAPWRIRVRSAVRLLRREACPPPPRHLSPPLFFPESRSPGDAKLS